MVVMATPVIPIVVFTLKPFMVKTPAVKISTVFPFKNGAVMRIIITVAVMPLPCGISVIGIPRIISFIDAEISLYMHLRLCGAGSRQEAC